MPVIDFIWAGGEKPIPDTSISRIKQWSLKNPGAEIHLWIDRETIPAAVLEKYQHANTPEGFKDLPVVLRDIRDIPAKIDESHSADGDLREQLQKLYLLAVYEFNQLRPNYGASSDIFRYLILFLYSDDAHWHAYFDHDVDCGENSIEGMLLESSETLFFHPNAQLTGYSGNDAFICRKKHHPQLRAILIKVLSNYTEKLMSSPSTRMGVYFANDDAKEQLTIKRTGPKAVAQTLFELYKKEFLMDWKEENFIMWDSETCVAYECPSAVAIWGSICPGNKNERSWIGRGVRNFSCRDDAIAAVLDEIRVEANLLGVIHLDDHVANVAEALGATSTTCGLPNELERDIAAQLVALLETLNTSSITERPLISRFGVIRDYYERKLFDIGDCLSLEAIQADEYLDKITLTLKYGDIKLPPEELAVIVNHWQTSVCAFVEKKFLMFESKPSSKTEAEVKPLCDYINNIINEGIPIISKLKIDSGPYKAKLLAYQEKLQNELDSFSRKLKL